MPAIKLFVATVKVFVGSNEEVPGSWKAHEKINVAEAERDKASQRPSASLAAILFLELQGLFMMSDLRGLIDFILARTLKTGDSAAGELPGDSNLLFDHSR